MEPDLVTFETDRYTIRHARKTGRDHIVVWPDGSITAADQS